jgi:chromosome segregation protein
LASDQVTGLLGSVAALITVEPGHEQAIAALLAATADALAVSSLDDAVAALRLLRVQDAGRADLVITGHVEASPPAAAHGLAQLPPGAVWARTLVRGTPDVEAALDQLLAGAVVVDTLDDACALVQALPGCTAATVDGDVLAPRLGPDAEPARGAGGG